MAILQGRVGDSEIRIDPRLSLVGAQGGGQGNGVGGGLDSLGVEGLELVDVVQDTTEIVGHGLDLVLRERQASQIGGALNIFPGDPRHGGQS